MTDRLDSEQVDKALDALYEQIAAQMPGDARIVVVGIRTRGETLAGRLVARLQAEHPQRSIEHGVLDITFYRDDLSRREGAPLVRATEIPFDIDDAWLLLVDDVLHTGRSARAALDALHDFGRPRCIRLAVLVDRGGRELPIAADMVGLRVSVDDDARVQVRLKENDDEEGISIIRQDADGR